MQWYWMFCGSAFPGGEHMYTSCISAAEDSINDDTTATHNMLRVSIFTPTP